MRTARNERERADDIRFSFAALAKRGGETGPHADGWGITFLRGARLPRVPRSRASARTELAKLLRRYPIKSRIVVAHVRKANRGRGQPGEHPPVLTAN